MPEELEGNRKGSYAIAILWFLMLFTAFIYLTIRFPEKWLINMILLVFAIIPSIIMVSKYK